MPLRHAMDKASGSIILLLIVLLATSSILAIQPVYAQSIPKPSLPEVTVKLIDSSYDVPATYSTDPYNGEKILVEPAHKVNNGTIELWIKNQHYTYSNGSTFRVYYNVKVGGHFGNGMELYPSFKAPLGENMDSGWFISIYAPLASDETYTVISLSSVHPSGTTPTATYPPNSKIDIQVKALVGHDSQLYGTEHLGGIWGLYPAVALDAESDWNNVQTLSLSDGSVSNSIASTASPDVPELSLLAFLPACLSLICIVFVLKRQKR